MKKFLMSTAAALAVLTGSPLMSPAQAQPAPFASGRTDLLRAGPFVVRVFEGVPPTMSNGRNGLSRGIRVYERPRRSTFAAVAAQEIFEYEFKMMGGRSGQQMELISHEIESLVASRYGGMNLAAFEEKEARALSGYAQFRGMGPQEILMRMRAMRPIAEQWLARNPHVLNALLSYRFPR